jgi:hypothetical protein
LNSDPDHIFKFELKVQLKYKQRDKVTGQKIMTINQEAREQIIFRLQNIYAIARVVLYWTLVALVVLIKIGQELWPVIKDFASAWISDQLGYTKGFFVERVEQVVQEALIKPEVKPEVKPEPVIKAKRTYKKKVKLTDLIEVEVKKSA